MPFITPEDVQDNTPQVFPDSFTPPSPPVDQQYFNQKAVTTGIATAPPDANPQQLENHIDNTQNQMELGNEQTINTNLAYDQKDKDRQTQADVLKNSVINNDPETFNNVAQVYANPKPPTNTEVQVAPYKAAIGTQQNYAATENATQAKAQEQLSPEVLDEVNDLAVKHRMIADEMAKLDQRLNSRSIMDDARDLLGLFVLPLQSEYATSGNLPISTSTPAILTGSHIQDENTQLYSGSMDDFVNIKLPTFMNNVKNNSSYVGGENLFAEKVALSNALNYTDDQASIDNALSGVDHMLLGVGGFKALRGMSRLMLTTGARVTSTELNAYKILHGGINEPSLGDGVNLVKDADGVYKPVNPSDATMNDTAANTQVSPLTKYITQGDAITDSQHSGFVPNYELTGTNAPTAISNAIDKQEILADRLNQIHRSPYLTPDQQDAARLRAVDDASERLLPQGLSIADSHLISQPNSATTQVGIKIGNGNGTGWATEDNARAAMENSGYGSDDFQYIKGVDNLSYPVLKQTVSGNGLTPPADIDKLSGGAGLAMIRKYIQNTDVTDLPELEHLKTQGAYTQAALEAKVYHPLLRPASELGGQSQNILGKVINYNMDNEKDLNITEFRSEWNRVSGKQPTTKEITAYYSLRQANNVTYALDNRRVFEDYAINGYKDYEFPNLPLGDDGLPTRVRGRRVESLPTSGATRIYNDSQSQLNKIDSIRQSDIANLKEEGYHLFETHDLNLQGGPVTHVLSKIEDYTQHELSPYQVNYKPGTIGPRIYKRGFFLKQPQTHAFEDGVQYRGKDITHFYDRTRNSLEEYAGRYNKAIDAFKEYKAGTKTLEATEKVLGKNTSFETVQAMQEAMDKGMLSEHSMQVLRDGEKAKLSSGMPELGGDSNLADFTVHLRDSGQLVTSARGQRLTTPSGEKAQVLDVYSSVSRAASTAMRHTAFDVYKKTATDKWFTTAQKLQVLKAPEKGAGYNIFDKDPYLREASADVKSKLETMRMSILRNLGAPVKSQQAFAASMEHLGDWFSGQDKLPYSQALAVKSYDLMSTNPFSAIRGLVFHKTLSVFNPSQLIFQPSTMVAAISAHPVYGIKSAMSLPLVRLAVANGSKSVLDYLAKSSASKLLHGMGEDEFKLYISELKNSGIAENSSALAYKDNQLDVAISQSRANLGAKDMVAASSWFFNEGNKINQLVGHGIAWRKAKDVFGIDNMATPQVRNYIASESTKLAVSMKGTSAAFWQKGLLSLPTEFFAYTERMMNWVLPAFAGGDARFTAAQKLRVLAGQTLFFGKYGVPIPGIAAAIAYTTGVTQDKADKWAGGIMDGAASAIFGTDVSYSQRAGVGENIVQLIQNISQNDFAEVMGGASFTSTSNFLNQLHSVVTLTTSNALLNENIKTADRMDAVMAAAQELVTDNVSSFSNAEKAKMLYTYGKFISNTGKTVITKPELVGDHLAALAVMLGIPLSDVVKANDDYQTKKQLLDTENRLVNTITPIVQDYVNSSSTGDYIEAKKAMDRIQIMQMILPDNLQQKSNIEKRVWKETSKDLLQTEEKQLNKLRGQPTPQTPDNNNQ